LVVYRGLLLGTTRAAVVVRARGATTSQLLHRRHSFVGHDGSPTNVIVSE
jgi:hypothetical protein